MVDIIYFFCCGFIVGIGVIGLMIGIFVFCMLLLIELEVFDYLYLLLNEEVNVWVYIDYDDMVIVCIVCFEMG